APHLSLISVLLDLCNGRAMSEAPLRVTFPEGTSIYKMGSVLSSAGAACADDFRSLVDSSAVGSLGPEFPFLLAVKNRSMEGYLFPDTYVFNRDISAEALARLMLRRFSEVVLPYWNENKFATQYDLHQILTLASIIEKEAKKPDERPIISSVFHNRLDINMPLAADPTVKYALERPSKTVYFDQLKVRSPYNTYKNRGLPPGPISNPGLDSIKAAIYPAKTEFLFFVAKLDGSHIFSASWTQHEKARVNARIIKRTSR
ncbi:MAG TPA: endolytic transglycosylase MltG, partial [Candidatus Omnitrophota bacterium]|nr:endolytic transglycosylase MltG [Candidatus Omnitrophota bacterium]